MQPIQLGECDTETKPPQITTKPARKERGTRQRNKNFIRNKGVKFKERCDRRKRAGAEFKAQCRHRIRAHSTDVVFKAQCGRRMKVRGVCVDISAVQTQNLRCVVRAKFNALKFCAIILCDWCSSGIKGKMAKFYLQFARGRNCRAKFYAIAEL